MIINWGTGGEFQSLSVGYARIWTSAWTAIYAPTLRDFATFTNLRTIVAATKRAIAAASRRSIVSATKRDIVSSGTLREIS